MALKGALCACYLGVKLKTDVPICEFGFLHGWVDIWASDNLGQTKGMFDPFGLLARSLQASELFITTTALHRSHPHTSSSPAPHPHTNRAAGRMWDDVYRSVLPVHTLADVEYYKVMLSLAVGAIFVCVVIAILLSWFWHHKVPCSYTCTRGW